MEHVTLTVSDFTKKLPKKGLAHTGTGADGRCQTEWGPFKVLQYSAVIRYSVYGKPSRGGATR